MSRFAIADIVIYTLSLSDIEEIQAQRTVRGTNQTEPVVNGNGYPAIVTAVQTDAGTANLKVLLDGDDEYWAKFRAYNPDHSQSKEGTFQLKTGWRPLDD